jgi:hypothetical protein
MHQQDSFAVRKFKAVVMAGWFAFVDLSESGGLLSRTAGKKERSVAFYLVCEGKLGAGKQADSHVSVIH